MSEPYPQQPHGARSGPPRYQPTGDQYGAVRPGAAPPEVARLLTLTLVSAAVYLLNEIAGLITATTMDMTEQYRELGLSAEEIAIAEQTGGIAMVTGIVTLVIALGLYALVHVFLKKGRNWARVLGIVLSVLSIVSTVVGILVGGLVLEGLGIVALVLAVLLLVVNVLWLVAAFKAPVKHWFTPSRTA